MGNLASFCSAHVDIISMGALTQGAARAPLDAAGYPTVDFSLKVSSGKGTEVVEHTLRR